MIIGEEVVDLYITLQYNISETFKDTKRCLTEHFAPKRNAEYEIYMFRQCVQNGSELIDSYYTTFFHLYQKHCEFYDAENKITDIQKFTSENVCGVIDPLLLQDVLDDSSHADSVVSFFFIVLDLWWSRFDRGPSKTIWGTSSASGEHQRGSGFSRTCRVLCILRSTTKTGDIQRCC